MNYEANKMYIVKTESDLEGKSPMKIIGYATGKPEDIMQFYDDKKMYKIELQEATIENITPKKVETRKEMINEKRTLEERLKELNNNLGVKK